MNLTIDQVRALLQNYASILPNNASIKISDGCNKTDGYLSYIYKIAIYLNENNNTTINSHPTQELIIKCAPEDEQHRQLMAVRILYLSEIYFYTKILPEFDKIRVEALTLPTVPRFITAVTRPLEERVILEDVRQFGYKMRDKVLFLDEAHAKFLLREFGKFHAFSFALKNRNGPLYERLVKGLKDIHGATNCTLNDETLRWYKGALLQVQELFQAERDIKILKKLKCIEHQLEEHLGNILNYKGPFGVVSHMDCWTNNMLFRYHNNILDSICFLDFQYIWVVSPATDFAFNFYVNCKPEEYHKFDEYLMHYYQSLKSNGILLGLEIEAIYSYATFIEEMSMFAKYGFFRGIMGIPMTMRQGDEIIDVKDVVDKGMDTSKAFGVEKWNPKCADWMRKLTMHMIENNFI